MAVAAAAVAVVGSTWFIICAPTSYNSSIHDCCDEGCCDDISAAEYDEDDAEEC